MATVLCWGTTVVRQLSMAPRSHRVAECLINLEVFLIPFPLIVSSANEEVAWPLLWQLVAIVVGKGGASGRHHSAFISPGSSRVQVCSPGSLRQPSVVVLLGTWPRA